MHRTRQAPVSVFSIYVGLCVGSVCVGGIGIKFAFGCRNFTLLVA